MLLKNGRVVIPKNGTDEFLDIRIKNGIIAEFGKNLINNESENVIDLSDKIIAPGFIDMHCHLREPGFNSKETIKTGIESALAGGYTAICPMANTNPAVDNPMTLRYTIDKAKEVANIGFFPISAFSKGLEGEQLVNVSKLISEGAVAFSDDGKPVENMKLLKLGLEYIESFNSLVISHSEDSSLAKDGCINESFTSGKLGLNGISTLAESIAVARELEIVRLLNCRYHFAHISTKRSVELIRQAKDDGLKVTCETAPHYFSLSEEDIVPYDSRFKMNPPLRSEEDRKAIIEGLIDGSIDVIATDHAPHTVEEKQLPIQLSPMGISGFETAVGLTFTNLYHNNSLDLLQIVEKFTSKPAKILNIDTFGNIQIGSKANLTIIDLNEEWTVNAANFKSKCRISPFDGQKLKGKAVATVIENDFRWCNSEKQDLEMLLTK